MSERFVSIERSPNHRQFNDEDHGSIKERYIIKVNVINNQPQDGKIKSRLCQGVVILAA